MIDRRLLRDFDWTMLGLAVALSLFGVAGVYSATHAAGGPSQLWIDHLGRIGAGFVVMLLVTAVDYHLLLHYAWHFFALATAALLAVDLIGMVGMGAQRWLSLGVVSIQPSEFFKIALVLMLARSFGDLRKASPFSFVDALPSLAATAVPVALVLRQPDLGTAMIIAGIYAVTIFVAGVDVRLILGVAGGGLAVAGVLFGLHASRVVNVLGFLHDYQVRRLRVLFNPDLDPLGAGYHVNQSKIAIGSGGLTGRGFLHGTQSGLNFLPQQHTDFIFSVISEEGGFIAAVAVIVLLGAVVFWAVNTARRARDFGGGLIATGVATIFFLHCVINIGMTTGILPVVGLPLPILSYGGSSVLTTFIGLGLIMNVRMRRFLYP